MAKIAGKRAIVTGGSRGIGLAIATSLLREGCQVVICARESDAVMEVVGKLSLEFGDKIRGRACDVRDFESVRSLFTFVDECFGGLDVLVNNAGVGLFKTIDRMAAQEWEQIIGTNLSGVFLCCREAVPRMKEGGGGYIINIGSLAGKEAFAGATAYCASKFGLVGFSEALMQEVRYDHIKVSYIMPGSVNTSFGHHEEQDPDSTWKLLSEDIAQVVINLLEMDGRALASRIELRPSEPKK